MFRISEKSQEQLRSSTVALLLNVLRGDSSVQKCEADLAFIGSSGAESYNTK